LGIWALGYDNGYTELWNVLEDKLTNCASIVCSDTIYDTGGAYGKYRLNENYTYLISSNGTSPLSIDFVSFDVEPGSAGNCDYDYLEIFDGPDTTAALIGKYCNDTGSPGTINGSGSSITLRFHSDGATQNEGWVIATSCIIDTIKPTTQISTPPNPATMAFNSTFTDADNIGGSGVKHQFYQVADNNGTEWRSNLINGFYNDEFDNAIHTDWIDSSGTWSIVGGYLAQTDEANSNTNLYSSCNQNAANKFLYTYQARLNGSGSNKRAGFHYMCDDASQSNRGNSYFVWFRQDDAKLQFYKVTNNVFSLEKDVPLNFNANQWYDIKIVYDKTNGETEVWMDDEFISSWVDPTPVTLGNYISLRSGNTIYDADDLQVYKARTSSETITVGSGPNDDIGYPGTPSGRINSIAIDSAYNVSTIVTEFVNVDLTTGIDELEKKEFKIYPNPTSDNLTLEFREPNSGKIVVTDALGKRVKHKRFNSVQKLSINLSDLDNGIYFLRYKNETVKFIKN